MIIFGLAVALLGTLSPSVPTPDPPLDHRANKTSPEFQIPPQVSRYASFLFSLIGRGFCKYQPWHYATDQKNDVIPHAADHKPPQSTSSSAASSSARRSSATSPAASSASSVSATSSSSSSRRSSPPATCARLRPPGGALSRCKEASAVAWACVSTTTTTMTTGTSPLVIVSLKHECLVGWRTMDLLDFIRWSLGRSLKVTDEQA
jgi:hypothetical protein